MCILVALMQIAPVKLSELALPWDTDVTYENVFH